MTPFLYDLLRGLRSKGVLLMMGLTTLLAITVMILGIHVLTSQNQNPAQVSAFIIDSMGTIYGFFVPILGIVAGYEMYARDRVSGVLESVLCRPVTREELVVSRYLALVTASGAAILIALGLVDAVVNAETAALLPAGAFVGLFLALWVEAAAFGGMVILLSHVFRSTGAIQGISVVLFVLFSIIWYIIVIVALVETVFQNGISGYQGLLRVVFIADYFNPAQFSVLLLALVEHSFFFFPLTKPPADVGVTVGALVASGLAWSIGPFLFAYGLAKERD